MMPEQSSRRLDAAELRARRKLAASRAARNGISSMVDSLRLSKPPRAPPSTSTSRRHALIPLAEGREELEARIRTLEDTLATRDESLTRLKKQWGRALVRRRHAERERDTVRTDLTNLTNQVAQVARASHPASALDDIAAAIDVARNKITSSTMFTSNLSANASRDDDNHSVASYASSTTPEDRATQIQTLTELVDILESRIAASNLPVDKSTAIIKRAKNTLQREKEGKVDLMEVDENDVNLAREKLEEQIKQSNNHVSREDAAVGAAAKAQAELQAAQQTIIEMRQRLGSMEKLAEKASRCDELVARNEALERELQNSKKMMGRLVQERNALKKNIGSARSQSHKSSISRTPLMGDSDAMRRILDWRQRASSGTNDASASTAENDNEIQQQTNLVQLDDGGIDRGTQLPDRITDDPLLNSPTKKRRMAFEGKAYQLQESNSASERSIDGIFESTSVQSLPVRGFLRRHDSFLSAGGISASGDEITIINNRDIFKRKGPKPDGLRGLLPE